MNNKFLSLLGMARKANRLSMGYDKAMDSIHSGKARVVFCANDLSVKTKRGLVFAAQEWEIDVITVPYDIIEMTNAVGYKTGVVSITDSGFAKKLVSLNNENI